MSKSLWSVVCAFFFLVACGDDTSNPDGALPDAGGDVMLDDLTVDGTIDDGPLPDGPVADMPVADMPGTDMSLADLPASDRPVADMPVTDVAVNDMPVTDMPVTDMAVTDMPTIDGPVVDGPVSDAPLTKPQVLFSTNNTTSKYTLATVALDGTGFQTVPGLPANMDICSIGFSNIRGPIDVRRDRPQPILWGGENYISLPGGRRLYRAYDGNDYSLLLVGADASVTTVLSSGATTTTCNTTYRMSFSKDGTLAAAVRDNDKIALIRLDGTTWPGSTPASPVLDVTPTVTTNITTALYNSLTMGSDSLLFITEDAAGDHSLYSAPLDGSAKATPVTVPNVGGVTPVQINTSFVASADGKVFATVAGSSSSSEDVIVIKNGVATNLSGLDDNLHAPGLALFDQMNPRMALSKTGTYLVFGATGSASAANRAKVWVAKTDGTSTVEISTAANFVRSSTVTNVDQFGSHHWVDDDNLLFWAGTTTSATDLFHYQVSTTTLANVTQSGTATTAPWDGGSWEVDGGWVNPAETYLYYVMEGASGVSIIAVNLTTFAKTDVATGLTIDSESELDITFEGQQASNNVWFFATAGTNEDLFVFDQSTAGTPTNLTNHTAATTISYLTTAPDGSHASYLTGGGASTMLYAVAANGTPTALNGTGSRIERAYVWTADSTGIVYGTGTSNGAMDLYLGAASGGTPTLVYAAQSTLYVFGAGK